MAAAGRDLAGEARLVDAMVGRGARILDAGCRLGQVGAELARLGHDVVGLGIDPVLTAAAVEDHPGPRWDLTLTAAAIHLGVWPGRIGELELGRRSNNELATRYRAWLNAARHGIGASVPSHIA